MEEAEVRKKAAESENKKMFRSRFDIFVLNALEDKDGASYGYDVINYIQNRTKGHYKIKTFSTIYNTLKRLEEQNFVVSGAGDGETNGAARVYYTLTPEGRKYLEDNKQEYKYLRTLLDNLLTDEDFDLDNEEAPYKAGDLKPFTKRNRQDGHAYSSDDNSGDIEDINENEVAASSSYAANNYDVDDSPAPAIIPELSQTQSTITVTSSVPVTMTINDSKNNAASQNSSSAVKKRSNSSDYKAVFEKITAPVVNSSSKKSSKPKQSTVSKSKSATTNTSSQDVKPIKNSATAKTSTSGKADSNVKFSSSDIKVEENNIEKFRNSLRSEGFVLNTYRNGKETASVKYLYVNRLMRDSVVLSALYMIVTLLVLYFLKNIFGFTLTALLVCGSLALAGALIASLIWFRNPDKRRRDTVNLKAINAATIGFFTVFFMIDLIVSLLVPGSKGLTSPEIYSPVIIASTSVFLGLVFTLLYKSDNYFQK